LREPYILKKPNGNLGGKDKAALVAKDLGDFLGLYKKETEMFTVYREESGIIPRQVFEEFVSCANDSGKFLYFSFFLHNTSLQILRVFSPCRPNCSGVPTSSLANASLLSTPGTVPSSRQSTASPQTEP
jgi:hypothetical protein